MTDNPVAMITGASRGIGAATAIEFARNGYDLVLMARNQRLLEGVAERTRQHAVEAIILPGDLSDLAYARLCIDRAIERYARIDVLVNNAVWRKVETMRETDVATWERTLRVCLTAPAFLARWAAEVMEQHGRGVIVNVSSIRARRVDGTCAAYVACKGALDALTYDLAALYGPAGVRVVGVSPGAIDTDSSHDLAEEDVMDHVIADFVDRTPIPRMGRPEEVAAMIAVLASDRASYVTGTTVTIDGGHVCADYGHQIKQKMKPDQFS
jgi:3-oxoacyl-[acyl-carrier protein] reductase